MKVVVVGAGISGLATAYALLAKSPKIEMEILEAEGRAGGKVWSERTPEGFLCERGVPGFLDNKPRTLSVAAALGLRPIRSFDASRKRYIYSEGRLHRLPEAPPAFFRSKLLSPAGRLRIIGEIFMPRGRAEDESLADFATRRLGREAFLKLIDPMATGIYAGDAARLSLKSCFPRIHEIEQRYGSLIRGMLALRKEAKRAGRADRPSAGPGGVLTSFPGGMEDLPAAMAEVLGDRLRTSAPVRSLLRRGDGYELETASGERIGADRVVLAAPAYAQADILEELLPELSRRLREIPYPPVAVCCFGYPRQRVDHALDGFGFLVPSREERKVLGVLWESSIFPGRAPEGHVLIRSIVGGARSAALALLDDGKLVETVRRELGRIMGIQADPDFVRIYRWERAIPQYLVGHSARLEAMAAARAAFPGLFQTGNAFRGVSLNDCITNGYRTADEVLSD